MNSADTVVRGSNTEINVPDLFWTAMANWRKIIVGALIIAFLFGALKAGLGFFKLHDPDYRQEVIEQNELNARSYESQRRQLADRIRSVNLEIDQLENYKKNSALYAIDPYNVLSEQLTYYVDAKYEIFPQNSVQNPDYTQPIVNAYIAAILRIDVEELLAELEGRTAPVGFDESSSFISCTQSENNGLITVFVYGSNEDQLHAIVSAIDSTIEFIRPSIQKNIYDHTISLISSSISSVVSDDFIQLQQNIQDKVDKLTETASDTIKSINNLKEPTTISLSSADVFKDAVIFAVAGWVVGCLLMFVYYVLRSVIHGVIADPEDVMHRYHTGVFCVQAGFEKANKLDNWIARHRGIDYRVDPEANVKLAIANIKQECCRYESILLSGTVDKGIIKSLSDKIGEQIDTAKIVPTGNVCKDAEAVYALAENEAVILVEEIGKSSHVSVQREIDRIRHAGKQLIGFMLLGQARN